MNSIKLMKQLIAEHLSKPTGKLICTSFAATDKLP